MIKQKNFALLGAAGFVAGRHMASIKNLGHKLLAACDPHDNVGILDRYAPDCEYFKEIERFERHLDKLRRSGESKIDYVSICTPNYLHDSHCRLALRSGADAICEKPLVINPWNLDALETIEQETGHRVYNILQLRLHPAVKALKASVESSKQERFTVDLKYVTRRGAWYLQSWKGDPQKSGSVAMNIGVHFFDMMISLFGKPQSSELHFRSDQTISGITKLEKADVNWFLSVDLNELPEESKAKGNHAYRSLKLDGQEFDFSTGFDDLHQAVYADILAGKGFGITDARPAIELVYSLNQMKINT